MRDHCRHLAHDPRAFEVRDVFAARRHLFFNAAALGHGFPQLLRAVAHHDGHQEGISQNQHHPKHQHKEIVALLAHEPFKAPPGKMFVGTDLEVKKEVVHRAVAHRKAPVRAAAEGRHHKKRRRHGFRERLIGTARHREVVARVKLRAVRTHHRTAAPQIEKLQVIETHLLLVDHAFDTARGQHPGRDVPGHHGFINFLFVVSDVKRLIEDHFRHESPHEEITLRNKASGKRRGRTEGDAVTFQLLHRINPAVVPGEKDAPHRFLWVARRRRPEARDTGNSGDHFHFAVKRRVRHHKVEFVLHDLSAQILAVQLHHLEVVGAEGTCELRHRGLHHAALLNTFAVGVHPDQHRRRKHVLRIRVLVTGGRRHNLQAGALQPLPQPRFHKGRNSFLQHVLRTQNPIIFLQTLIGLHRPQHHKNQQHDARERQPDFLRFHASPPASVDQTPGMGM